MNQKVPLQGTELDEFLAKERAAKEKEAAERAAEERRQRILEADEADSEDSESDSDSESEDEVERELGDGMDVDDQGGNGDLTRREKRKNAAKANWSSALDDDGVAKQMLSYDIYLKGNVSKATSFFKSADGQSQRFRMFPYVEKKRRVDDYGELLDVEMWLRKGKALEDKQENDELKELKKIKADEEVNVSVGCHNCRVVLTPCLASTARASFEICHDCHRGAARMSNVLCGSGRSERRSCCENYRTTSQPTKDGTCVGNKSHTSG